MTTRLMQKPEEPRELAIGIAPKMVAMLLLIMNVVELDQAPVAYYSVQPGATLPSLNAAVESCFQGTLLGF